MTTTDTDTNPERCMACGSHSITGGEKFHGGDRIDQMIRCHDCHAEWTDTQILHDQDERWFPW